ncbi:MAG: replicative DNA helicase [Patescibacteria group bacterium]
MSDYNASIPPHDSDAEKSLLGLILLNGKVLDDVADKLKPEYLYDPRHIEIYQAMLRLWSSQKPVDIIFVLDELKTKQNKEESNSINKDFLLEIISKSSLSNNPEFTARIIKEKYMLRTLINVADELKVLASSDSNKPTEILDLAQKKLYEVSLSNIDKNFTPIREVLGETFERIQTLSENQTEFRGIPTGFMDLDSLLGGFHNSDLVILAARPSMGKTAFALEIAQRMALKQQAGVAVFSLEMSKDQLVDRVLASVSGLEMRKIRTGRLDENGNSNEFVKLGNAINLLSEAPIWIDDSESLNILELRSKARRLKSRHNLGVVIIDYLQLMSGKNEGYKGNRVQEVSDISRGLKMLAKELDIPVIALSQLSRNVEGREDKRPMLSDLRESGSIEQDADVVIFIHREEMYHKETKKKGIADILVSKHRNGEVGTVELAFVHRLATFENLQGARVSPKINQ